MLFTGPVVLTSISLSESEIAMITARYHVVRWSGAGTVDTETLGKARAMLVSSQGGLNGLDLGLCPRLGLVHCFGAGYEGIDFAALASRGIRISADGGAHSAIVADHALALWLAGLRRVIDHDRARAAGAVRCD